MKTHGTLRWSGPLQEVRPFFALRAEPHVLIKIKRLFPRCDPLRDGWVTLKDTAEVARDIEWLVGRYPLDMDDLTRGRLFERADEHRATEQAVHDIISGRRRLDAEAFREVSGLREHREYQYVAADLAIETGRLLLTDDLGLGKSMSALLVLRAPDALPALIVCLTHLPTQWEGEVHATYPELKTHIARKMDPYTVSRHRSMRGHDPDVLIVPYSKLRGWGDHLAGLVKTVIFDEVQELRKAGSQKYTAAARVADQARYKVGLSATPIYNYAGEIHTIYEVIAPGVLGTRDEFIREWGGRGTVGGENVAVRDPAALGIYLREEGLMLRRTRREVGRELPEVVRVPHAIDTDEDMLERLSAEAVELADVIVQRALGSSALYRARGEFDWRMRRATGLAKASYVADFVRLLLESEEKVVLWGWHRDVYRVWQAKLADYAPLLYTGSESPAGKQRARDAFVSGDARLLVMSLRSGAGLDGLQEVCHVGVFGELDWSPGMHDQCVGRLHRDGQDEPVVAYFLVSDGGSDPLMAEVLNVKRQQADPINDPNGPLLRPAADVGDRIGRLAAQVVARRRSRLPAAT